MEKALISEPLLKSSSAAQMHINEEKTPKGPVVARDNLDSAVLNLTITT